MGPPLGLSLLILAILLLPDGLPSAGFWWDLLVALGYCGLVGIAYLGWDSETPAANPRLRLHRNLAIATSTIILAHTLGYLVLDSTLVEYLKPTAPAYMLAGLAAFLCLAALTISSFPTVRRRTYGTFSRFRAWHRWLFLITLAASLWHALGTGYAISHPFQAVGVCLMFGLLPLAAYQARRRRIDLPRSPTPTGMVCADRAALAAGAGILVLSIAFATLKGLLCETC